MLGNSADQIELSKDDLAALRALREEEIRIRKQRINQVRDFGLKYYNPHPKQKAFHAAGNYKRRAVFAGNRFGKSDCGAAEDCAQALGHRPWLPETSPECRIGIPQRPQKILILTTDWQKVDEIFTSQRGTQVGKLWKYLPRGFVTSTKRNHSGALEIMECANGALIQFDTVESFKKNPQGAESSHWDVIHVDEPCPQKMYAAHARGLMDRGGQAYFTLTPLKEPWIYDMFYGDGDTLGMVQRGAANIHNSTYWSVTGSIWDNIYLDEADINLYLSELDPEERECREKGIPLQFAGLIYKEFESAVHIMRHLPKGWLDFDSPPDDWPVYLQLDPHPQTPSAGLLCTVDENNIRRYIFNEIWYRGTCDEVAKEFFEKLGNRYLVRALGDPSIFNEDKLTGSCAADDFGAAGLWLDRAVKDLDRGILAVKKALKARDVNGDPLWLFSPYLRRFVYEIKRWHWDKDNKPTDKDDHTLECMYRMVLDDPRWAQRAQTTFVDPMESPITGLTNEERFEKRDYTF